MKKRLTFIISILMVVAMLAACAPKATEAPAAEPNQLQRNQLLKNRSPRSLPLLRSSPRSLWPFKVILPTWDRSLP